MKLHELDWNPNRRSHHPARNVVPQGQPTVRRARGKRSSHAIRSAGPHGLSWHLKPRSGGCIPAQAFKPMGHFTSSGRVGITTGCLESV